MLPRSLSLRLSSKEDRSLKQQEQDHGPYFVPFGLSCFHRLPQIDGLNDRYLFSTVLEVGNSDIKGLANSVPDEGSFLGL